MSSILKWTKRALTFLFFWGNDYNLSITLTWYYQGLMISGFRVRLCWCLLFHEHFYHCTAKKQILLFKQRGLPSTSPFPSLLLNKLSAITPLSLLGINVPRQSIALSLSVTLAPACYISSALCCHHGLLTFTTPGPRRPLWPSLHCLYPITSQSLFLSRRPLSSQTS